MTLAHYLSRASMEAGQTIELETTVHVVNGTHNRMKQIKTETKTDPELGPLLKQIAHGWPDSPTQLQKGLKKYWYMRDHLSIDDGPILKGSAIMILCP